MKLTFLGTRGEIDARTELHARHTSLLVEYRRRRVMVDAGRDWLGHIGEVRPHAIVVTHAHPDHAFGLEQGAPCPVWLPPAPSEALAHYPLDARDMPVRRPTVVEDIAFEAFPVEHSIRAPAVGYRITAGAVTVWYSPDVLHIPEREDALRGVRLFIGDGATIEQNFVRRAGKTLVGHANVRAQLGWCAKEGVARALITHCGEEIVTGDADAVSSRVAALGAERGVEADVAVDGMTLTLR